MVDPFFLGGEDIGYRLWMLTLFWGEERGDGNERE